MGVFDKRIFQECGRTRDLEQAKRLHSWILQQRVRIPVSILNLVIEMFGKCGSAQCARSVFDSIPCPNLLSWSIMLTAYAQNGHIHDSITIFKQMPRRDVISWNSVIQPLSLSDVDQARLLFHRMPQWSSSSWNSIITAYAQRGDIAEARFLFERMPEPDSITSTAIMGVYLRNGHLPLAQGVFSEMLRRDIVSWNALATAYFDNERPLEEIERIFKLMPQHDQVACNLMLDCYCSSGKIEDALRFFHGMVELEQDRGNTIPWNMIVHGCGQKGDLNQAKELFDRMPWKSSVSWTVMLTVYGLNGELDQALQIFNEMPAKTVVPWNAIVRSIFDNEDPHRAAKIFELMPGWDMISWNTLLVVWFESGELDRARDAFNRMPEKTQMSWNILVAAVAEEGQLFKAEELMRSLPALSSNIWNALIAGYARNGHGGTAVSKFFEMVASGFVPNSITFVCVLVACSHTGLRRLAAEIFSSIQADWGMMPGDDHYNCLVDTLCRSGELDQAEEVIESMDGRFELPSSLLTLLSACNIQSDADRGAWVSDRLFRLEPRKSSPYLLLFSAYASS